MKQPFSSFVIVALVVVAGAVSAQTQKTALPAPTAPADGRQGETPVRRPQGRPSMREPDFSARPPVRPLTPAQEAKTFWLPPGFKLEAVLTEPDIQEPGQIAFDGNGRMFVLELRGYMQTVDADGELDPVGRISVHEDKDHDGVYESHGVFVDNLVFPRFVTPFGANAVLTKESNTDEVWKYTDTNNDGVADKKELFTTGLGRLLNIEHQESGFIWAMDNWIYSTINTARIRWTPNGVLRESTGPNGGQWGISQDNFGKPWFQGGASGMPGYFQFPVVYGAFRYPEQFEKELELTWGAPVRVADMQEGMDNVRMPDGSLARATGAAGNDVFRGDRLPPDMVGDLFYGETVARIVRRLRPVKSEGLTQLRNVYPMSEFIRSTDPLFRPVDMTTAPDGTLYITDMYRGIIQESQWSGPGTYLRKRIEQYALDKVIRHGRIWRLTYEGMRRRTKPPRMLDESPGQLVRHLADPNGWWRDTAQQLLVLGQQTPQQKSQVLPALEAMANGGRNQLARLHAMWTLEGLGAARSALVRRWLKDKDPVVRQQAVRVSETLYKAGDRSFAADYKTLAADPDDDVVIQVILTMNTLKVPDAAAVVQSTMGSRKAKGVQLVGESILAPPSTGRRRGGLELAGVIKLAPEEEALMQKGEQIYQEVCIVCHGSDGHGEPVLGGPAGATRTPALAGSPRLAKHHDYVIKTLLHGLTGPIDGKTYPDVMVPMGAGPDDWIAAIASYVRNAFGNRASMVTAADVARVRAATESRTEPWTVAELERSLPRMLAFDRSWKVTASHNTPTAADALTIKPWTTGKPQEPGMWLQVELPAPTLITEVQFDSSSVAVNQAPAVPGAPTRTGGTPGVAAAPTTPGYPRAYQVRVSLDGSNWGPPVADGKGSGRHTNVPFAPVRAKFVRMIQTERVNDPAPWAVERLRLFEPGTPARP